MAKAPPKIENSYHPEFKVIYASGVFGSMKADEGFMKFHLDIVKPRVKAGGRVGEMEVEKINRQYQVEIRMTSATFIRVSNWMARHVKELEKKGIVKIEKKPTKKAEMEYRI